ncbi:MAG: hypothetical protein ACPL3C_06100 [Pyrobaculum sp.]|uniref:Uncharacterized protein n=1 Tax=Pyrobaculum ferrireducens TaxID=1104324 RepID=G7VE12_9CREN|nr:hypothetical protein [Pyrobaculum ferrireducens]AET32785.1 hypothetical protein P186_1357 [Pyrobaculum ferrireducens]
MEAVLLIREFEREPYELVDVLRFERGRRYIYRLAAGDREYFIHVVAFTDVTYVEFWHPNYAVPLLVFRVLGGEELSRVLILLRSLVGR